MATYFTSEEQAEEQFDQLSTKPAFETLRGMTTEWGMEKILAHFAGVTSVKPVLSIKDRGDITAVLALRAADIGDAVLLVTFRDFDHEDGSGCNLFARISTASRRDTDWYEKALLDALPPVLVREPDDNRVFMNFSTYDPMGGVNLITRQIDAPDWADVAQNYPGIAGDFPALLERNPADIHGKVALLSGPPGTGKTTLLRSWAREWHKTATFIYVADAEEFFTNSKYTLRLLFRNARESEKWTVLLFEDAEEFITKRGKDTHKKALRNLLNVGDGMIGQGMNILTVFTTNAENAEVDPAVKRKGRCFLDLEVPELTTEQANAWLEAKGSQARTEKPEMLGDLYGMLK